MAKASAGGRWCGARVPLAQRCRARGCEGGRSLTCSSSHRSGSNRVWERGQMGRETAGIGRTTRHGVKPEAATTVWSRGHYEPVTWCHCSRGPTVGDP
jgi:hypothetical protein